MPATPDPPPAAPPGPSLHTPTPKDQQGTTEGAIGELPLLPSPTPTPEPPPGVALFFLIDRSKSLRGCFPSSGADPRLEIPRFLITLLKNVPSRAEEWPKVGLAFFGGGEDPFYALQPAQELDTSEGRWQKYQNALSTYDRNNDYPSYLEAARQALQGTGADEKIIVIISDGKMDEHQTPKDVREEIRRWFGEQEQEIRVVFFQVGCREKFSADDMSMWNDKSNVSRDYFFCDNPRYCQYTDRRDQIRYLIESTQLHTYLPLSRAGWLSQDEYSPSIPAFTQVVTVTVVVSANVRPQVFHDDILCHELSSNGVLHQIRCKVTAVSTTDTNLSFEGISDGFLYYYYTTREWLSKQDVDLDKVQLEGTEPVDDANNAAEYVHWNDNGLSVSIPKDVFFKGDPKNSDTLNAMYFYEIRISVVNQDYQILSSRDPQPIRPLFNSQGPMNIPVPIPPHDKMQTIRIILDVVRKQAGNEAGIPIARRKFVVALRFFPMARYSHTDENGKLYYSLRYATQEYYEKEGNLHIYMLTTLSAADTHNDTTNCAPLPKYNSYNPFNYKGKQWYILPESEQTFKAERVFTAAGLRVGISLPLSNNENCAGYEKVLFQWEDENGPLPLKSAICDLKTQKCNSIEEHVVKTK